jgi:UPF0716 family protein affecting phage T7 exclusion
VFLLTLIVAATNFVLGYALAVLLGWASLPDIGRKAAAGEPSTPTHGN